MRAPHGVGQPREPVAVEVERHHTSAVQDRAEQSGDRTAEARRLDETQSIFGGESQRVRITAHVVQHVAMRIGHALRSAGRARGVEHAGDVVRGDGAVEVVCRTGIVDAKVRRHVDDGTTVQGDGAAQVEVMTGDEQCGRIEIVDHGAQDRRRQALIEGRVTEAGLEDRERPDDRCAALGQEQRDRLPRCSRYRKESACGTVGRRVQLRVGHVAREQPDRGSLRAPRREVLESAMNRLSAVGQVEWRERPGRPQVASRRGVLHDTPADPAASP